MYDHWEDLLSITNEAIRRLKDAGLLKNRNSRQCAKQFTFVKIA